MARCGVFTLAVLILCHGWIVAADEPSLPAAAKGEMDFVRDIQPIFKDHCLKCHGPAKQRGDLRLDNKSAAMKGGESFAPDIIPGDGAKSPLVRFAAGIVDGMEMPPEGENKLSSKQIGMLRAWIDQGAKWPEEKKNADDPLSHWSFQPLTRPEIPNASATNSAWTRGPVDPFIVQKLEQVDVQSVDRRGLRPSAEADRTSLIRRLTFDLTGLPPSPAEVAEFVADGQPDSCERLVDRLLASPHFGERWARHWLDVVRFAESDGFETNQPRPNAWPYRDYVIRAFNEDKPFTTFLFEQLAGDTMGVDEATGFIVGGAFDRVKSPDPALTAQQRADELHDMVSTTGSAFFGLTVGCARCHNHKFDPISQTDYYSMKAVFAGVQHGERPLKPADFEQRRQSAESLSREIAIVDQALSRFEPLAFVVGSHPANRGAFPQKGVRPLATPDPLENQAQREGVRPRFEEKQNRGTGAAQTENSAILLDDEVASLGVTDGQGVSLLVPRIGLEPHRQGTGRGQLNDPGSTSRYPNLGRNYSYWKDVSKQDVFTWNPAFEGRGRVWISWGCGWNTHATDAVYLLDQDGDLSTRDDQVQIAQVDQRRFADGNGGGENQPLWSSFFDAGVHNFAPTSRIVLRGGDTPAYVTADLLCLQPEDAEQAAPQANLPRLRPSVQRQTNVERFAPVQARFVRFTIDVTTGGQPCLDELEVFASSGAIGTPAKNIALASLGTRATSSSNLPGFEIHQLAFVNDGRYGNSASWISNEPNKGWVQLEFPAPVEIDRILWSRDRPANGQYQDRIPTRYRIEAGLSPESMSVVASSDDRLPFERKLTSLPTIVGLDPDDQQAAAQLTAKRESLQQQLQLISTSPMVYAGRLVDPEATFRLHRGDPMQPKEPTAPAGLGSLGTRWTLPVNSKDQERRRALATWITESSQPLTARVMANRLWHFHFGQGLVATPSDFGRNGVPPSHPALLDWLASELRGGDSSLPQKGVRPQATAEHDQDEAQREGVRPRFEAMPGDSPKRMHRLILTSATYRQSSDSRAHALQADAGTRLLWRYPPHRLEAEAIRDAILSVSGNLDDRMYGVGFDLFEPNTNYVKVYNSKREMGPKEWRRMVYQSKPRMQLDEIFGQFDCPDAGQITPRRTSSITALQALNLLNSPFIVQQSSLFASRLEAEAGRETATKVQQAYRLAFQRQPSSEELDSSIELIHDFGLAAFCRAILNANEFLFVF